MVAAPTGLLRSGGLRARGEGALEEEEEEEDEDAFDPEAPLKGKAPGGDEALRRAPPRARAQLSYKAYRLALLATCVGTAALGTALWSKWRPTHGPEANQGVWAPWVSAATVSAVLFISSATVVLLVHMMLLFCGQPGAAYAMVPGQLAGGAARRDSNAYFCGDSLEEKRSFVVNLVRTGRVLADPTAGPAVTSAILAIEDPIALATFKADLDHALRAICEGESLYSLVFSLLQPDSRGAVLSHIQAHLANDAAPAQARRVLVVSDMDDTLVSTFKDRRFPWNTIYPGVRKFYHELICSQGAAGSVAPHDWARAKDQVTFVTARPSWLNGWTHRELQRHGFETSVALTGSSVSFITPATMLARKLRQCREMRSLWPEAKMVLVGDNGQRDIDLGRELLAQGLVEAVFIHDIFEPLSYGRPEIVHVRVDGARHAPALGTHVQDAAPNRAEFEWTDKPSSRLNALASDAARSLALEDPFSADPIGEARHLASGVSSNRFVRHHSAGDIDPARSTVPALIPGAANGYRKADCTAHGIVLFQSYCGAALEAVRLGLLDVRSLLAVAVASAEDFVAVDFATAVQLQRQKDVFLRDVARVAHFIADHRERIAFLAAVHGHLEKAQL